LLLDSIFDQRRQLNKRTRSVLLETTRFLLNKLLIAPPFLPQTLRLLKLQSWMLLPISKQVQSVALMARKRLRKRNRRTKEKGRLPVVPMMVAAAAMTREGKNLRPKS
jgi:hypothetical protein